MTKQITLAADIWWEMYAEECDDENGKYKFIECTEWSQDYKYQLQDFVIQDTETSHYYVATIRRSGSPFSDWDYMDRGYPIAFQQCQKKEIKTYTWEPI